MAEDSVMNQIDNAIGKHYRANGDDMTAFYYPDDVDSPGKFAIFCEENGLDDDEEIEDDLNANDPDNSQLIDFAEDDDGNICFPGIQDKDSDGKRKAIYRALIAAYNGTSIDGYAFESDNFDFKKILSVPKHFIETVKKLYQKQMPSIMDAAAAADGNFCHLLAAQRMAKFDYFQFMVTDFHRWCVRKNKEKILKKQQMMMDPDVRADDGEEITVANWARQSKHLASMTPKDAQIISSAVEAFSNRIIPRMLFDQSVLIQDRLAATVEYINGAAFFVHNMVQLNQSCPFQLDVVFTYPNVRKRPIEDDDGPEEKEEATMTAFDFFGDLEERLKANKANYVASEQAPSQQMYAFRSIFEDFKKILGPDAPIQFKRLCISIDRGTRFKDPKNKQAPDNYDKFLMFESPEKSTIPRDAVPEWGFDASKISIIPRKEQKKGGGDDDEKQEPDWDGPISALTNVPDNVDGQVLGVSFHAKSADCIQCWLFINGQLCRFMAEDITDLLPLFFDAENTDEGSKPDNWKDYNGKWSMTRDRVDLPDDVKISLKRLQDRIIDAEYESFSKKIGKE